MRKNELFEQNSFLFNRLQSVNAELEKYKKLYEENIKEINALRHALAEMETEAAAEAQRETQQPDISAAEQEPEHDRESSKLIPCDVMLDGADEYGAEIIGKIVLEGAKASHFFAESPNEYSKDLINLVLGKTEVCKAQIYDICKSDSDEAVKCARMDVVLSQAVEYFNNLNEQV